RYRREALVPWRADIDPEFLLSYFLGQLIYDTDDIYSAMRGHGLARSIYSAGPNVIPFNDTGRLHNYSTYPGAFGSMDEFWLVNTQHHDTDPFLRDPERTGYRSTPDAVNNNTPWSANVPYTYPDLNNMFLAAVDANGKVLSPSFHRSWTGVNWANTADPWQK